MSSMQVRYHMIQRLLEDPSTSLSTIKDDDRIAAFKAPKFEGKRIYLQLTHRRQERYVIFVTPNSHESCLSDWYLVEPKGHS